MPKRNAVLLAVVVFCATLAAGSAPPATFESAKELLGQERWADAATAFGQVENAAPGKTDALLYRGEALSRLKQFNEAADALEAYLKAHPASADGLYVYAEVLYRQGRPQESLKAFKTAADLRPPTAPELITVALDYSQLEDTDDASYHLERALALAPDNFEAKYQLGRVRYRQRRFEDAVLIFQELVKRDPANLGVLLNLGLNLETSGRYDAAADVYRKAITLEASSKHRSELPYLYFGRMLVRIDKTDDAITVMRQGLIVNPRCSRLHSDLGHAYLTQKRMDDAQSELEEAVRLDPRSRIAHYFLTRVYLTTGQKEKAEEQIEITKDLSRAEGRTGRGGMGSPLEMPPE